MGEISKIIEVDKCESCPMFSKDIDDSEYCSKGGSPEDRYVIELDEIDCPPVKYDLPEDCPLQQGEIVIRLKQEQ